VWPARVCKLVCADFPPALRLACSARREGNRALRFACAPSKTVIWLNDRANQLLWMPQNYSLPEGTVMPRARPRCSQFAVALLFGLSAVVVPVIANSASPEGGMARSLDGVTLYCPDVLDVVLVVKPASYLRRVEVDTSTKNRVLQCRERFVDKAHGPTIVGSCGLIGLLSAITNPGVVADQEVKITDREVAWGSTSANGLKQSLSINLSSLTLSWRYSSAGNRTYAGRSQCSTRDPRSPRDVPSDAELLCQSTDTGLTPFERARRHLICRGSTPARPW
jgi:hypothetical protein